MAMVKIALLLLVAFKAAALENSHDTNSNHELFPCTPPPVSPLSYALESSVSVGEQKQSSILCAIQCATSCGDKKSFLKVICILKCVADCLISPSDSLDDINCVVDCAQFSANDLRYDANMINDRINSCHQQCKKD